MAIQDTSVASTIVTAVWTAPEVPGALGREVAVLLFNCCDVWRLTTCVAETMPDRVADSHSIGGGVDVKCGQGRGSDSCEGKKKNERDIVQEFF